MCRSPSSSSSSSSSIGLSSLGLAAILKCFMFCFTASLQPVEHSGALLLQKCGISHAQVPAILSQVFFFSVRWAGRQAGRLERKRQRKAYSFNAALRSVMLAVFVCRGPWQVDNPVAVMDQENSKQFIKGSEREKYAFFKKATELKKIEDVSL